MKLLDDLKNYIPYNEQEKKDLEVIADFCAHYDNLYKRETLPAHITASAWVMNEAHDKILMAYHKIYRSWAWLGGHADGEEDLLTVAIKEAVEESGTAWVRPVTEDIFSAEVLTVSGHEKRGQYVSSHLHLNVTYLLEADETESIQPKPDENSEVGWFSLSECLKVTNEEWMRDRIYKKLLNKMKKLGY